MDELPPSDESDEAHGSSTLSLSLLINRRRPSELESSLSDADEQQHGSPVAVVPITGETVGLPIVGSVVGSRVGSLVGVLVVGLTLGMFVGPVVGSNDGSEVGISVGSVVGCVGSAVGSLVGCVVGSLLGTADLGTHSSVPGPPEVDTSQPNGGAKLSAHSVPSAGEQFSQLFAHNVPTHVPAFAPALATKHASS